MDEAEFAAAAERVLERIEASLEESGVDADVELKPGGVIEIEYADGSRMVINPHAAPREICVAPRYAAFPFRSDAPPRRGTRAVWFLASVFGWSKPTQEVATSAGW